MGNIQKLLLNRFIIEEIDKWRQEQLIDSSICDQLIARYPVTSARGQVVTALITLGAVLVGLGTLLFIAAHWTDITVYGKLFLIFLSIVISTAAGWWFQFDKGNRPKLGAALFLLGSFFYGAGIWLVCQIFNISGDFSTGLFLWAIGTTAMALATRSSALGIMSAAIISSWTLANTGEPGRLSTDLVPIFTSLLGLGVSIFISYYLRSPWSLGISLIATSIWFACYSALHEFAVIILACTFFNVFLLHQKSWQDLSGPYKYIGVFFCYGALLIATFDKLATYEYQLSDSILTIVLLTLSLSTAFITYVKDNTFSKGVFFSTIAAFVALCTYVMSIELLRLLSANMLFLGIAAGLFYIGLKKLQSPWFINTSIVFLIIDIFCRYFDTFFSIMDRSLFFIIGGVLLMIIGAFAESKRRAFLEGIKV